MKRKTGVIFILLLLACTGGFNAWRQYSTQTPDLIRLHVVANSNMFYDQDLKYRVKDRIVRETSAQFSQASNAAEAREITNTVTVRIADVARDEIKKQGFDYPVRVELGSYYFPLKSYSTLENGRLCALTLPPDRYEAVRVVIGEGQGANWWCVLYPPLCFADMQQALPPAEAPAFAAVQKNKFAHEESQRQPRFEYRFRVAELWRELMQKHKSHDTETDRHKSNKARKGDSTSLNERGYTSLRRNVPNVD